MKLHRIYEDENVAEELLCCKNIQRVLLLVDHSFNLNLYPSNDSHIVILKCVLSAYLVLLHSMILSCLAFIMPFLKAFEYAFHVVGVHLIAEINLMHVVMNSVVTPK